MTRLAILDGDLLAYRCAAANEKRTVEALHNTSLEKLIFNTVTDFKSFAGNKAKEYTLTPVQTAGDVAHACYSLKSMINNITEKAKCDSYHVVISGENNFRLNLPLPTQYKSNRKGTKPLQLAECKKYLIDYHQAEVSEGEEADDLLCQYAYDGYKNNRWVVQCTIDKDAQHGPYRVFDWTHDKEPKLITGLGKLHREEKNVKGYGRLFLYYQCCYGDVIDGYKPCELAKGRFGEVAAYNILRDCNSDKEALDNIVRQYKTWYPKSTTYYAWNKEKHTKDWLEIFQMYVDCAFMRRWQNDRLDVEKLLKKMKVNY